MSYQEKYRCLSFYPKRKTVSIHRSDAYLRFYQDSVEELRKVFDRLTLIVDGIACIKIADPEVKRILVEHLDRDGNGEVNEDESVDIRIGATWFRGNQKIKTFCELKKFKGLNSPYNNTFNGSTIEEVEFSAGQSLAGGAFNDCLKLRRIILPSDMILLNWLSNNPSLDQIDLPETIKTIEANQFTYSSLSEIVIPENVETIGAGLCRYCHKLRKVIIKTNLITAIGGYFLVDCPNLEKLIIYTVTPPTFNWGSFDDTPSTVKIYVPDASVSAYKTTAGWKNRANYIYPISSYEG